MTSTPPPLAHLAQFVRLRLRCRSCHVRDLICLTAFNTREAIALAFVVDWRDLVALHAAIDCIVVAAIVVRRLLPSVTFIVLVVAIIIVFVVV